MKKPHTFFLQSVVMTLMMLSSTPYLIAQTTIPRDTLLKELQILYTESVRSYRQGDFEQMLTTALEAEKIYFSIQPEPIEQFNKIFNVLGIAYQAIGDYDQSILYLQKRIDMLEQIGNNEKIGGTMMNLGLNYKNQGQIKKAITQFLKALPYIEKYQNNKLLNIYNNLGNAYKEIGEYELSEQYHHESLVLKREKHQGLHNDIATTYFNLGALYIEQEKYKEAKAFLDTCLQMRTQLGMLEGAEMSNTYYKIGLTYRERGLYQDALTVFQQSIKALVPSYDTSFVASQPHLDSATHSKMQLLYPLMAKAKTLHRIYQDSKATLDSETALSTFRTAVALIDKIRGTYDSDGSKQDLMNLAKSCYEGAIQHVLFAYEETGQAALVEEAFQLTERSKAILLNEAIKVAAVKYSSLPDSLFKKEAQLKEEIARLEHQLTKLDEDEKEAKQLRQEIFDLKQTQSQLIQELESNYLTDTQVKIATIAGVQDSLIDEETMLIEYFLSDSSLFIFAISKDEIITTTEKIDPSFFKKLDSLRLFVSQVPTENEQILKELYKKQAHEMYQLLFPFLSKFKATQLLIIPDAELGYLPFETLLSDNTTLNQQLNYNKLPYLLKSHDVRYEYSASTLLNKTQQQKATKNYLGIAPGFDEHTGKWRAIPSSKEEVQTIAQIMGGDYLMDDSAQKQRFLQAVLDYNTIHLATHAFSDPKNPLHQSAFVFAPHYGADDSLVYEYLYAYELYQMQINADLAVLSACDTGTGKLENGEGIMSLARAFKYAGCSNIVTSLWPANDQVTKTIMVAFFKNLKQGVGKTTALQQAKKAYLDHPISDRTHPAFWATFILIGDNETLDLPASTKSFYGWGIALLGMCLGLWWWKR